MRIIFLKFGNTEEGGVVRRGIYRKMMGGGGGLVRRVIYRKRKGGGGE